MNTRTLASPRFTFSAPAFPRALQSAARALWRALPNVALGCGIPLGLLALWQFVYVQAWIAPQILPSPQQTWEGFRELYGSGDLALHLSASLQRVAWSVAIGGVIGLALGFVLGLSSCARAWIYPSFAVFAQFPVIGWIPLLMLFIGIDEGLKITAISLAVIVPVAVSTYKGILRVPCALLEVGRVYAFSRHQSLLRIVVPAALPAIFTGVRQGVMQAWLALIFVELLAASEGLGFLMIWSRQLMYMDLVFVAIIAIGIIGYGLDFGLRRIEHRFNRWKPQGL
ncbi:MAG: ABC transporter permease [Azoarcus sp.]|jgi:sulfonate transport system permease protein|nr:ABC transporter permease [Azoarcus sp.]